MTRTQSDAFSGGEADAWYQRNREKLLERKDDAILALLKKRVVSPRVAFEYGCSNGYRLSLLKTSFGCRALGIDPSSQAVEEGKALYPGVEISVGNAASLAEVPAGSMDLVIVNFVLAWLDRSELLSVTGHLDRILADKGILCIGDFYPAYPCKVRYHHREDVSLYTYKQDYAAIFTASGLYSVVDRESFSHADGARVVCGDYRERCLLSLLQKDLEGRYELKA